MTECRLNSSPNMRCKCHWVHLVDGDKRIGDGKQFSLGLIHIAENVSLFAVLMAFISLGVQEYKGERMDGLSGINVDMCRATQQLH
eukprot:scaffold2243_cov73-Cyclotella_meneghiniana.AAC.3